MGRPNQFFAYNQLHSPFTTPWSLSLHQLRERSWGAERIRTRPKYLTAKVLCTWWWESFVGSDTRTGVCRKSITWQPFSIHGPKVLFLYSSIIFKNAFWRPSSMDAFIFEKFTFKFFCFKKFWKKNMWVCKDVSQICVKFHDEIRRNATNTKKKNSWPEKMNSIIC